MPQILIKASIYKCQIRPGSETILRANFEDRRDYSVPMNEDVISTLKQMRKHNSRRWTRFLSILYCQAIHGSRLDEIARATLDPISEPDVDAAWSAEIQRRLIEIDAGAMELIPWDKVRLELFGESEWRE